MLIQLSTLYTPPLPRPQCRLTTLIEANTMQYHIKICNAHNVCQLAESQARAVTGGIWQGYSAAAK